MTRRLLCMLLGHRWQEIAINMRKHINLCHLSMLAGMKSECERCGKAFDDTWGFGDDVVTFVPQPLPRAQVVTP